MKKKKDPEKKSRYLLVIITILCISAMALTASDVVNIEPLRQAAGVILLPFQNGISRIGGAFSGVSQSRRDAAELAEENERLQNRVDALEEEITVLKENENELQRLRDLFQLDADYSQYDKVAAQVISRDPGNWFSSFMINRGTESGIEVDMNVISSGGLVGIVTETGKNWSTVRPIIDDTSNVSAMALVSGDTCIISGDLDLQAEGKLAIGQLNKEADVSVGAKIVTSTISEKYLEGILIGYVDSIEDDPNHLMRTGTLIPAADFEHMEEVLVILQRKMPEEGEEG